MRGWLVTLWIAGVYGAAGGQRSQQPWPAAVQVGLLPDRDARRSEAPQAPLLDHVSAHVGLPLERVPVDSYADLESKFERGEVQLGLFGALSYLRVSERTPSTPLVLREIDLLFTTYMLGRPDAEDLESCRGESFMFGGKLSTSGHVMPRYHLEKEGIEPERFFSSVEYSDRHDATIDAVRSGRACAGAADSLLVDALLKEGELGVDQVRVLMETPPYPNHVWVARGDLPEDLRWRLRDAFLALTTAEPGQAALLRGVRASTFLPALALDFRSMRPIGQRMGLLQGLEGVEP